MLSFPTLELDVSHALVLLSWMLSLMRDFNNKEKKNEMQLWISNIQPARIRQLIMAIYQVWNLDQIDPMLINIILINEYRFLHYKLSIT